MTDVYPAHSQFILLTDSNRRRWFDARTVFVITVITLPIIIFCGIYTIILRGNESLLYPKSHIEVPRLWENRAKQYSYHFKDMKSNKHIHLNKQHINEIEEFKLVCYYNFPGSGFNTLKPENIDPQMCSHINVAFARVVNNTIHLEESELEVLQSVVKLKLKNEQMKILISVGGAADDGGYGEMVLDHTNRKRFIKSVVDYVKSYGIDGIDLDWEFPNRIPGSDVNQKLHFTQLLEELRLNINKQHKHKFILTVAVAAPEIIVDESYDVQYMSQFVDFINIMAYDYHFYSKLTPFTGLNSPLYPTFEDKGLFAQFNINHTMHYWLSKGMAREKIVMGLPTYGHSFRLTNSHNNGLFAPARSYGKLGSNGFVDYIQVCKFLAINQITPFFNIEAKSPYASKGSEWISFENEQSLAFKAEYIRDQQLGGVMIYSLNSDDHMGACKIDPVIENEPFPLVQKVREILNRNYSLF